MCAALTSVAGSSAVVRGGVVSYAIPVKQAVLGVDEAVVRAPGLGVVSAPCAEQMALGACHVLGCDVAVSVTGIAGPGGAEPGKPIGTVWFGVARRGSARSVCRHLPGDREEVRHTAVRVALGLLLDEVMEDMPRAAD